jgi:two-component system, OmpR family, response regulator RegX3
MKVLLVDDEDAIRESVAYAFRREGFDVVEAADGSEAMACFDRGTYDVVVLDVMLGDISGIDVCREMRTRSAVPILMLTARDAEVDRVVGLELGADDYVTKPFSMVELVSRIRVVLRRRDLDRHEQDPLLRVGDLEIDLRRHEVRVAGKRVRVTPTELRILTLLAGEDRPFGRREILRHVWDTSFVPDERSCDVHIANLRSKLGRRPDGEERIVTVRGVGYRLPAP